MKWITGPLESPDRNACVWLIKRFIDERAEFIFAGEEQVMDHAEETGAVPFAVRGSRLFHHGEGTSFDAILEHYGHREVSLLAMADIVRDAEHRLSGKDSDAAELRADIQDLGMVWGDVVDLDDRLALFDDLYEKVRGSESWSR